MAIKDDVAQAIWQEYAVSIGRALPAGFADRLAQIAIQAMDLPQLVEWAYRQGDGRVNDDLIPGSGEELLQEFWLAMPDEYRERLQPQVRQAQGHARIKGLFIG